MTKTAKAGDAFLAHPSQVAANRVTVAALIASNLLGQNASAIMAAEAQYAEMWAQDVTAMEGYHKGTASGAAKPELLRKATDVLEKVDTDVTTSCPSDEKAFTAADDVGEEGTPGTASRGAIGRRSAGGQPPAPSVLRYTLVWRASKPSRT